MKLRSSIKHSILILRSLAIRRILDASGSRALFASRKAARDLAHLLEFRGEFFRWTRGISGEDYEVGNREGAGPGVGGWRRGSNEISRYVNAGWVPRASSYEKTLPVERARNQIRGRDLRRFRVVGYVRRLRRNGAHFHGLSLFLSTPLRLPSLSWIPWLLFQPFAAVHESNNWVLRFNSKFLPLVRTIFH